jgi:quercetin dioxygenase-like cupin family protein
MTEGTHYFRIRDDAEVGEGEPRYLNVFRDVLGLEVERDLVLRPVFGINLTLSFVSMEPHAVAPVHQHPQEQIGTVIEGSYEFELAGEKRVVRRGDVYVVPPNVPHGAVTHDEGCLVLDVFSPPREAFDEIMKEAVAEIGRDGAGEVWTLPAVRAGRERPNGQSEVEAQ